MRRVVPSLIALIAWFALVLQFCIMFTSEANQVLPAVERVVRYFSFFTILTNIIVALTMTAVAMLPENGAAQFFFRPSTQAAVTTYISIVGMVYSLVLRAVWDPTGWQAVADHLLHDAVPLAAVLYWLTLARKDGLRWVDPLKWLIYPSIYVAYSLVRGAFVNWYPYWFVDVTQLGYPKALTHTALVMLAFLVVGFVFVWVAKALFKAGARR